MVRKRSWVQAPQAARHVLQDQELVAQVAFSPGRTLDEVERAYIHKINNAKDSDEALELIIGLQQYRELYKPR